jgi:hypothetical protein
MGWATFLANFSQTHLVTLSMAPIKSASMNSIFSKVRAWLGMPMYVHTYFVVSAFLNSFPVQTDLILFLSSQTVHIM